MRGKCIVFISPPLRRYGTRSQPMGLLTLGTVAKNFGYETYIIDSESLGMSIDETVRKIIECKPSYLALTSVTLAIKNAAEIAERSKESIPEVKVILGGHHVTAVPEETMKRFKVFDFAVIGEGELTLLDLLNTLDNGEPVRNVRGIAYREGLEIRFTEPRIRIQPLDVLPVPDWSLLPDMKKTYSPPPHLVKKMPAIGLNTSRGCPGQCFFCTNVVYGRKGSCLSAEKVFQIIKDLNAEHGFKEFWFSEDNFLFFRSRFKDLCALLLNSDLDISWTCTSRVDHVNEDLLLMARNAGCRQIWYGIESGDQEILSLSGKGITIEKIEKTVANTKKYGIEVGGYFILGHPGETIESMEKTIDLMKRLDLDACHASFMCPFPGSKLYNSWSQFGSLEKEWEECDMYKPTFIPIGLTEEQLKEYSAKFYTCYYFRIKTVLSYIKRIRSFKHLVIYAKGFFQLLAFLTDKLFAERKNPRELNDQ